MSKITTIDKVTAKLLRERIEQALAPLAAELGVDFKVGNASFTPTFVKFQFTTELAGRDAGAEEWHRYCAMLRLPKDALGTTIPFNGRPVKIVGLQMSRRRYPVLVESLGGKRSLIELSTARKGLGLDEEQRA